MQNHCPEDTHTFGRLARACSHSNTNANKQQKQLFCVFPDGNDNDHIHNLKNNNNNNSKFLHCAFQDWQNYQCALKINKINNYELYV